MPPRSLRLPGAHGLSLHALAWSESGEPLLLVHGFGHDAHVWDEVAPALAPSFRTLALDLRGHGDSDRDPARRYSHEAVALDLAAVADALGPAPVVLVGHSMGAYGALRLAGDRPERVRALVLVDAGADLAGPAVARLRFDRLAGEPAFESPEAYVRVLARQLPRARPALRARLARHWLCRRGDGAYVLKLDPAFLAPRRGYDPRRDRAAWAQRESAVLWEILARLPQPVLVVRGAESEVLAPATAEQMANAVLRDGRLAVIPGAGHTVMLDEPAALAAALQRFLGERLGRGPCPGGREGGS